MNRPLWPGWLVAAVTVTALAIVALVLNERTNLAEARHEVLMYEKSVMERELAALRSDLERAQARANVLLEEETELLGETLLQAFPEVGISTLGSIAHAVIHESLRANVDPLLVAALMSVESEFKPQARSYRGAIGLMQLMPGTAAWLLQREGRPAVSEEELTGIELNVELGVRYFGELLARFKNERDALAAYEYGHGAASAVRRGERVAPPEYYVSADKVLRRKAMLQRLAREIRVTHLFASAAVR